MASVFSRFGVLLKYDLQPFSVHLLIAQGNTLTGFIAAWPRMTAVLKVDSEMLSESAQAAITKDHILGGLSNKNLFLMLLETANPRSR